jgi:hypothetical protein
MLKNILEFGSELTKSEQKSINGGINVSECTWSDGTTWFLFFEERWRKNNTDQICRDLGGSPTNF